MADILALCFSKSVVVRAVLSAVVVGTVLILINHYDAFTAGAVDNRRLFQISLTLIVPYVVSTVSSVITIQEIKRVNSELTEMS